MEFDISFHLTIWQWILLIGLLILLWLLIEYTGWVCDSDGRRTKYLQKLEEINKVAEELEGKDNG